MVGGVAHNAVGWFLYILMLHYVAVTLCCIPYILGNAARGSVPVCTSYIQARKVVCRMSKVNTSIFHCNGSSTVAGNVLHFVLSLATVSSSHSSGLREVCVACGAAIHSWTPFVSVSIHAEKNSSL